MPRMSCSLCGNEVVFFHRVGADIICNECIEEVIDLDDGQPPQSEGDSTTIAAKEHTNAKS